MSGISVLVLGPAESVDVSLLRAVCAVEVLGSGVDAQAEPQKHRDVLNPIVDRAQHPWILILRAGDAVSVALARELVAASNSERAWGYRLPVEAWFDEDRLPLRDDTVGAIRFYHRRHARYVDNPGAREMKVQGTVVRLREPIQARRSADSMKPAPFLERVARFARRPAALLRRGERRFLSRVE